LNKVYQITGMLSSDDYYVKEYALDALRKFDFFMPSTYNQLKDFFLKESNSILKTAMIKLFIAKKVEGASDFFLENISGCDLTVKNAIYDYVAELGLASHTGVLITNYYAERDPRVRSKLVKTIAALNSKFKEANVTNELIFDFFSDADARVRANACSLKACLNDAILKAEFKRLLKDPSCRVVSEAAIGLYEAGEKEVFDHLYERITSAQCAIEKASFTYAIGNMKDVRAGGILKDLLKDAEHTVRKSAINGLGSQSDKSAINDLIDLYFTEQKNCRENLSKIVASLKSINEFDSALAVLDRLKASNDSAHERASLVKLFAHFADSSLANYLIVYLDDCDARVRANSVEALYYLKERGVVASEFIVKNLLVSMCDSNTRVVANTVRALYGSGVVSVISVLREMLVSNIESVRNAACYVASYFPEGLLLIKA